MLQLGTSFYIALLLLLCIFGRKDWAAVIQMGATLIGLSACGSGATKVGKLLPPFILEEPLERRT